MAVLKTRVTVKDVAARANVTAQTVSRVMHSKGYVSEKTRQKVLQAVKDLNYIPSYAAKALRTGMAKSIAIIFDSLRNYYFAIMIDYLRQEIQNAGYSIQLLFSDKPEVTEESYRKAISHGAVAVISFLEGESCLGETVKDCGVPLLILGRSTADEGLDYITTDDVYGGKLAAEKLYKAGCKRFVYIMFGKDMSCVRDRGRGFSEALQQLGYPCEVYDVGLSEEEFNKIDLADPTLGIFCFNDFLAFDVLKRMGSIEKSCRAKLVGYDNIQEDMVLPLSITTIGPDKQSLTKLTVEKIEQKLSDGARIAEHQAVSLYEGETT